MIKVNKPVDCCGCNACASVCPTASITLVADDEGFVYPSVEESSCIRCGACLRVCPIINRSKRGIETRAFGCINTAEADRRASSSGGVFSALAERVLLKGGVVYGAAFDPDLNVRHQRFDAVDDLDSLRRSKYVQSDINITFKSAKQDLLSGRQVLFCATPCQIAGLQQYLGKPYPNLLSVDLVCHGVPSPKVWRHYLEFKARQHDSQVAKAEFRDKRKGWKAYRTTFVFKDGQTETTHHALDCYMRLFLTETISRPSCHDCRFKAMHHRASDITLADFWGVGRCEPSLNDPQGVSLVLTHTHKGQQAFDASSVALITREVDPQSALKHNPAALASTRSSPFRTHFFQDLDHIPFDRLLKKYTASFSWRFILGVLLSGRTHVGEA
jgi:coenzyme F420-reducing hydrogenase beta subunit